MSEFIPVAPQTAEDIIAQEQAFAARVQIVRECGDVLDARRNLWPEMYVKIGAAAGTLAGLSYQSPWMTGMVGAGVAAATVFGAYKMHKLGDSRERNEVLRRYSRHGAFADYELYAIGQRPDGQNEVGMLYHGPVNSDSQPGHAPTHLSNIVGLAERYKIDAVVISDRVTERAFTVYPDNGQPLSDWIKKNKSLDLGDEGWPWGETVYENSPEKWREFINRPDVVKTVPVSVKEAARIHPNVALVKAAQQLSGGTPRSRSASSVTVDVPNGLSRRWGNTIQEQIGFGSKRNNSLYHSRLVLPRWNHAIKGAATLLAAAVAFGFLNHASDDRYEKMREAASRQVAKEQGINPELAVVDGSDIDRLVDVSVANKVSGAWYKMRKAVYRAIGVAPDEDGDSLKTTAGINGNVGNITSAESKKVWQLSSNNMSTVGEWVEGTSWIIHGGNGFSGVSWDRSIQYLADGDGRYTPPTEVPNGTDKWIKVEGIVDNEANITAYHRDDKRYLPMPVLDGTKPLAANFDGQQVEIIHFENGTYAINTIDKDIDGRLTYWVGPAGPNDTIGPVFVYPNRTAESKMLFLTAEDRLGIVDMLEAELGIESLSQMDDHDQDVALANYVRDNFKYDLSPLPEEEFREVYGWKDLEKMIAEGRKDSCAVAATFIALTDQDLNVVFEYNNKATPFALDTKEAHMNLVERGYGSARIDGTSTQPFDKSSSSEGIPNSLAGLYLVPVGVALALHAYKRRREIIAVGRRAAAVHNLPITASQAGFNYLSDQTVKIAYGAINQIKWQRGRENGATISPEQIERFTADKHVTAGQARQALMAPSMHSKSAQRHLRRQPNIKPRVRLAAALARQSSKPKIVPRTY